MSIEKLRSLSELFEVVKTLNNEGLPFMEGREKGELVENELYEVVDYGHVEGEDGQYIIFAMKGHENLFFVGGSVPNEKFNQLEQLLTEEEIKLMLSEGIPVIFKKKKSKKAKRNYIAMDFVVS